MLCNQIDYWLSSDKAVNFYQTIRHNKKHSMASVRKRTIPTERPPLVTEVSANFLRIEGATWSAWRIPIQFIYLVYEKRQLRYSCRTPFHSNAKFLMQWIQRPYRLQIWHPFTLKAPRHVALTPVNFNALVRALTGGNNVSQHMTGLFRGRGTTSCLPRSKFLH
jgi:hypothetical protein